MKKRLYLLALLVCGTFKAFPQLTVTPSGVANTLAQVLAGNGVTISNASLNCGPNAAGTFTYTGGNLGMTGGIILTTGTATNAIGAGGSFASVTNGNNFNDPQLTAIEANATYDACILEFDFVPLCSNVNITFVFGSEEYPEFVGSMFNDAFGIFLSGPNPGGGNYVNNNIASLPNGTDVSINTVNAGSNAGYFYDNYTSPNNQIIYDGYTTAVTSTTAVTPCNSYHMKIAIADAGDGGWDSGVFIANDAISCTTSPVVSASATPASCAGNDGTATASVTSYTGTPTYTWTPGGQNTASITGLAPGTYTCVVGFGASCSTLTQTVTATVGSTGVPVVITVNSPSICVGGSTTLNASGASTYTWSPATGLSGTSGASVTANPGSTTVYTITGTSAGCNGTNTSTVTVNPTPTVTVNSATICPTATVTLNASGANTYTWSPGTGLSSTTGASVNASPASTTVYTISATSTEGCTTTATSTVTIGGSVSVSVNSDAICSGNSTTLNASGASTYTWSPGTGLSSTSGASVTANPGTTITYTVIGASGGCTGTATSTVTVTPTPTVIVNSPTFCIGSSAVLNASGATTYNWSPATGLSATTGASVTASPTVTTAYTVVGTTGTCTNSATANVTVNPLPTISVNNGVVCNGGSTTLTASGASTYTWSPATGLSATTGSSVNGNPSSTTQYTVTGTDINGCVNSDTTSITVVTNPTVTVNTATLCAGATTTLTANGASTYVWSPGTGLSATTGSSVNANPGSTTVYTITGTAGTCTAVATTTVTINALPTVTANSGTICIGQQTATLTANGASTYTWSPATGLSSTNGSLVTANPGSTTSYTVTGTDGNGCVNSGTTSVLVNPLPVITVNNGFVCNGSSVTLNANGASTYSWSPGTGLSATTGASVNANPGSTTQYTVTGTDANGCVNGDTTTVTVVNNPTVTVNTATICLGQQTATLTANGAATYVWSPGTGLSSTSGASVTANPGATTVYTITGTAGTCTAVATTTVTVDPLPVVSIGSNSPICVNQNLNLTSSGGTGYSWSGPNTFSSTLQNPGVNGVTTADAGIYTVTVTDANTCVSTGTVNVVVNPLPIVGVTGATVCVGATINLTSNGGVSYSWSGPNSYSSNQQNPSITGAAMNMAGNYVVTVTDANGCASGNVANVVVNPSLVIAAGSNSPICQNATLNLSSSTGVSWSWTGPNGFSSISQNPNVISAQVVASGTYVVTGTDANGCQGTSSVVVVINPLPTITANSGTICIGQQTATLTANGGTSYSWSPATTLSSGTGTSVTGNPLTTTAYTITGTDANGCVNTGTTSILVNPLPVVTANSGTLCIGDSITIMANGAATYTWNPTAGLSSSTGAQVSADPAATSSYTVTGTDNNGCYSSGTFTVVVNPLPIVNVNSSSICNGNQTTLNATGANTYVWSPATGLSSSTGSSVNANPASTSTYVVTGTDINGCVNTATSVVNVNTPAVLNVGPQISSGCAPVCVNLANTTSATGTCSWNFGDGSSSTNCNPGHCYTGQGTFNAILTFTDANGCVSQDTATVTVYPVPDADFNYGPQPTTILDGNIQFTDATTGAPVTTWNWTFGDANNSSSAIQNPAFVYYYAGSYPVELTVTTAYGCKDSTIKIVYIGDDYTIYVPNAFTPNFDGVNDVFMAKGEGIKDFRLYIFDRWGNQVFYSEDIMKGWDGRFQAKGDDIVQEDVYVWKIELKNYKGEPKQLKGTVSLLK